MFLGLLKDACLDSLRLTSGLTLSTVQSRLSFFLFLLTCLGVNKPRNLVYVLFCAEIILQFDWSLYATKSFILLHLLYSNQALQIFLFAPILLSISRSPRPIFFLNLISEKRLRHRFSIKQSNFIILSFLLKRFLVTCILTFLVIVKAGEHHSNFRLKAQCSLNKRFSTTICSRLHPNYLYGFGDSKLLSFKGLYSLLLYSST